MLNCLAVGVGGFVGAVLRYLVSMIPLDKTGSFPVNTLLINVRQRGKKSAQCEKSAHWAGFFDCNAGRYRGRSVLFMLPCLFPNGNISRLATPQSANADSVSLRLGHGAALTCPRHVIHYRAAASLPKRGAKRVRRNYCASAKSLPRSAPLLGEVARSTEGGARGASRAEGKDIVHFEHHRRGRPLCRPDVFCCRSQISLYIAAALDLLATSLTSVTSTLTVRWPNAISITSPTLT